MVMEENKSKKNTQYTTVDIVGLRLIAFYRFSKAIILTFVWYSFIKGIDYHQQSAALHLANQLYINPDNKAFLWIINKLSHLETSTIQTAGYGLFGYACILYVESFGLWFNYFWAKYLVIIGTGFSIPWEVFQLIKTPSAPMAVLLIANSIILVFVARIVRKQKNRP